MSARVALALAFDCLWMAGCASTGSEALHAYVESCNPAIQPAPPCIDRPVPGARTLLAGESVTVQVDARCLWNRTGILLEPHGVYSARTSSVVDWRDKNTASDPATGWSGPVASKVGWFARLLARDVRSPMYALVGSRGKDTTDFVALREGASFPGRGDEPAELYAFANDWRWMYMNNHGCLDLTVTRDR